MGTFLSSLPTVEVGADERHELLAAARQTDDAGTATPAAQDAVERLLAAYAPLLRGAVARTNARLDRDEAEAVAAEAFLVAARSHLDSAWRDFTGHVHAAVGSALRDAVSDVMTPFSGIDSRERRRFCDHLYRVCGGDVRAAYRRVGEVHHMSPERFADLAAALLGVTSLDGPTAYADRWESDRGPQTIAEGSASTEDAVADRDLVDWLLDKLEDRQRLTVELYYGFTTGNLASRREAAGFRPDEDLDDEGVGAIIGRSRSAVIRARHKALDTMRAALGVAAGGEL